MIKSRMVVKEAALTYPKLMMGKDSLNIVLMTGPKSGTVVHLGIHNGAYCVGEVGTNFCMDHFSDYNGKITLNNVFE